MGAVEKAETANWSWARLPTNSPSSRREAAAFDSSGAGGLQPGEGLVHASRAIDQNRDLGADAGPGDGLALAIGAGQGDDEAADGEDSCRAQAPADEA